MTKHQSLNWKRGRRQWREYSDHSQILEQQSRGLSHLLRIRIHGLKDWDLDRTARSLLIWLFVRARFVVVPGHDQPEG